MPLREVHGNQGEGRDNLPCPDCRSTDRVLIRREGDETCRQCGLVLAQILDDHATFGSHHDMYNDTGSTLIGQGGDRSMTSRLKTLQSRMSHSHEGATCVAWHAAKRARMCGTLCAITHLSDTKWFDNAWSMYIVVSAGRMHERLRDAMLAVCAYYAMFMTMTSKYSGHDLQVVFGVDEGVYNDAKQFAHDILLKTAEYGQVVTNDTDNPVEELERCIRGIVQISKPVLRLVQRLACDLDAMRLHLNILGASKLSLLRPAIIHLACEALHISVSLEEVISQCSDVHPGSLKTIQRNVTSIDSFVIRDWPAVKGGEPPVQAVQGATKPPSYQAWNAHVKDVQERVAAMEMSLNRVTGPYKMRRVK